MTSEKSTFHKLIAAAVIALCAMAGPAFSQDTLFAPDPVDPDTWDMSVWNNVAAGIHSGFGSLDSIYPKSVPPKGTIANSINLRGWKGERVSCDLLVWSAQNKETITILANDLTNGNSKIGRERIAISALKYVIRDDFQGCDTGAPTTAHLNPDLLSRANRFPVTTRENRPVWITVDIPGDIPAGTYTGTISRQSTSGTVNHSISVEVQNMVLPAPAAWSFHLDIWQHPDPVARAGNVPLWSQAHLNLLRPMLTLLAQAGQKCITTTIVDEAWNHQTYDDFGSMVKWTKRANGTWIYDYSNFDAYVTLAMECGINKQINCYSMAPVGNIFTWYDSTTGKIVKQGLSTGSTEYNNLWRPFLTAFRAHLQQKGWLGITAIAGDERGWMEMQGMIALIKATAPELKIALAGDYDSHIDSLIYDLSSYWGSVTYLSQGGAATRRKAGHLTTYYTSCNISWPNTLLCSPLAESCYPGWFASGMGFDGFLRWAYNSWPKNPNVDARYNRWSAGDCFIIYPEARSSIRFERLREGIQDFEKIRILRTELAKYQTTEAVAALKKLNDFLKTFDIGYLDRKKASDIINPGKQILYDIVKTGIIQTGIQPRTLVTLRNSSNTVGIYTLSGRKVTERSMRTSSSPDLSGLPEGVYLLKTKDSWKSVFVKRQYGR